MNNYKPRLVLCAVTVFLAVSSYAATSRNNSIQPVVQQINPDVKLIQFANGVNVEQLTGAAAVAHLNSVMLRHPDAFVAAHADLLARGFVPTNQIFVERMYHLVASKQQRSSESPYQLVQQSSEQNSDGEIMFESYDGPGDTWQGTIYTELYSDGAASTWDGQVDTGNQDYPYNWTTETWSYGGSDDTGPFNRQKMVKPPLPGTLSRAAAIQLASWKPGKTIVPVAVNWFNWSICWRDYVVGGCTTAAVGCIRVKAAWPACFATWCIGAEVGGAVACAMQNWH